jgi:hypothetical protein
MNILLTSARIVALGVALAVSPALSGSQAHATLVNGSDSIITFSVRPNGGIGDLLTATGFTFGLQFWGEGADDFSNVPSGTSVASSVITVGNLGSYSFSSLDGSFAAAPNIIIGGSTYTSAVVGTSGSLAAGSESLSLYIVGTFTPAGDLSGFDPNNASETISFTETGITNGAKPKFGSFSVSATFASPAAASPVPTNAPEPASAMVLGAGLLGLGAFRRRKA